MKMCMQSHIRNGFEEAWRGIDLEGDKFDSLWKDSRDGMNKGS